MKIVGTTNSNYGDSIKTKTIEIDLKGNCTTSSAINNMVHLLKDLGYDYDDLKQNIKLLGRDLLNTEVK